MRLLGSALQGFFTRVVIALVIVGVVTGAAIAGANMTIDRKLDKAERVEVDVAPPPPEGANYLVIGSDSREGVDTALEENAFGDPGSGDVAGQRSDTIMVVHVEPEKQRSFVVSFPRDLLVEVPGYGDEQINAAYSLGGPQLVVDTLRDNFDFEIHHYVEVGLLAFVDIVNAIGSVPVYLPGLVQDEYTGFQLGIYGPGCYGLDGEQALQYVRARNMQLFDPATGQFELIDPQSDINRIGRQQAFIKSLVSLAVSEGLNDPLTANRVADGILEHLAIDDAFSRDDVFGLLSAFRDTDPTEGLEMTTIPWQPAEEYGRLVVDEVAAAPVLARLRDFGGEMPADVEPAAVRVQVLNGTTQVGVAEQANAAFAAAGFQAVGFGDTVPTDATQILYAPGAGAGANLVKSSLGGVGATKEDSTLFGAAVVVVIGDDFLGVTPPAAGTATRAPVELVAASRPVRETPTTTPSTPVTTLPTTEPQPVPC